MNRVQPILIPALLIAFALLSAAIPPACATSTTYYSQGSLPPEVPASWNTFRSGGGSTPPKFTFGDTFVIQNGHSMTTAAPWLISGPGSKLWIESGGTLTANSAVTLPQRATFEIDRGGTYVHNNSVIYGTTIFQGNEDFDPGSTVILNNSNNIGPTSVAFGNLTINLTSNPGGAVNCSGGLTTINGNLTIQSTGGQEFRLSDEEPFTLNLAGDLSISGGTLNLAGGIRSEIAYVLNLGGNFNQTGGTFLSGNSSSPATLVFTGGSSSSVTFATSGGAFTNTNLNWQIAGDKTVALNTDFGAGSWVAAGRSMTVNGALRMNQGADPGTSGTWTYGDGASLILNSAAGSDGLNDAVWWPAVGGPPNVAVHGGGLTLNTPRRITGIFATSVPVTNGENLTLDGTLRIDAGGSFSAAPRYGSSSLLVYNSGGAYGRGAEWGTEPGQPGYPANVQISNNTILNYPNGSAAAHGLSGSLTIDAGSELRMDYGSPGLNQPLTVGGDVTLNGTLALGDAAGGDLNVAGNWTNNGIFDSRGRMVMFNGAGGEQMIGGSQRTDFGDLAVARDATVVVPTENPPTVAGAVTNDGTLRQAQTVDNATVQFLHLTDADGDTDKYLGVDVATDNSLGSTVVAVAGNQICAQAPGGELPVKRCYTVTPETPAEATVKFYFRQADLQAGQTVENLNVWNYEGDAWQPVTRAGNASACDEGAIDCWVSGTTAAYSPFVLKISSPLAVQLAAFSATPSREGVTLTWETVSETDNAGFNLYRAAGGPTGSRKTCQVRDWIKLNAALIPSAEPGSTSGHTYSWRDATAQPGTRYAYRLDAVDQSGSATVLGTTGATVFLPESIRLPWVAR